MFHPDSHLNKHGFFEVGDRKFYSKLDAVQHSIQTEIPVKWNFNNEVYGALDWTTEPSKSIRELYAHRARSLREKYDYIVCMFSGGSDSTYMLQSFIDNDLRVDEIFMNHWPKGSGPGNYMNNEIDHAALPFLKENIPAHWNTKIRLYDYTDHVLFWLQDKDFRERSYREINNVHNLSMISVWKDLQYRFPEYLDLHDKGKSLAFVWGEAKPTVDYDRSQQRHFFQFEDSYTHAPQPRDQEANDPRCNHEQFYNDPDHPQIKIKQSHLLLKTLKQSKHRRDIFLDRDEAQSPSSGPRGLKTKNPRHSGAATCINGQNLVLDRNAFNFTIYPGWNFLTYHEDKQYTRIKHPAHEWIAEKLPRESRSWYNGFIKTFGSLPEEWRNFYGNLSHGIKKLQVRYYIE